MLRSRLALAVCLLLAALVAACNIGPQPLPPGAEGDDPSLRADAGGTGSVVGPNDSSDAGAAAPSATDDAGTPRTDAGAFASDAGDAAATDAAPTDAETPTDAPTLSNDF